MMDLEGLQARLPVGEWGQVVEYHQSLASTNDQAWRLAQGGAPHGSLVVANEQTAGKGRGENRWFTPPDEALALSLVVRPDDRAQKFASGLNILGALAVVEAVQAIGLEGQIKWPNDVLLDGRKVCGVLSEASWKADHLEFAIVGIGVNVRPESVPPAEAVGWPAVCIEAILGERVDRLELLSGIIKGVAKWYSRLGQPALVRAWERYLAYKGRVVRLQNQNDRQVIEGRIEGLDVQGQLVVNTASGTERLASGAWGFSVVDRPGN